MELYDEDVEIISLESESKRNRNKRQYAKCNLIYETTIDSKKQDNYYSASFFSRLFFSWTGKIMSIINKRPLESYDLCYISIEQSIKKNISALENSFKKMCDISYIKYPLFISIIITHYKSVLFMILMSSINIFSNYLKIFFFKEIISMFSKRIFFPVRKFNIMNIITFKFNILECTIIHMIIKLFISMLNVQQKFYDKILDIKISNEITALFANKILRLNEANNNFSKDEENTLNMIETDTKRICSFFYMLPKIITAPFEISISIHLLSKIFGHQFIFTILGSIIFLFILFVLQALYIKNLDSLLTFKDRRMKIINFIFQSLKILKLNNLEEEFINRVNRKRNIELFYKRKAFNLSTAMYFISSNLNILILILSLGIYFIENKDIEVSALFASFQLIENITDLIKSIPLLTTQLFCIFLSMKRVQCFLKKEENNQFINTNTDINSDIQIKFDNTTFGINKNLSENNSKNLENISSSISPLKIPPSLEISEYNNKKILLLKDKIILLKNISLTIKKGEFIAVLGCTGSGKSCLLSAILNNYQVLSTNSPILINGEISYCSQISWIMTETIKNNIIFFSEFNLQKYRKIISLCHLEKDFHNLNLGENTIINNTYSHISSGQKARISLARCLYKDADLYLFDDPFSSIDNRISQKIFDDVFCDFLKNKTRILVLNETNNLSSKIDKIILMKDNKIKFMGTYDEFMKNFKKIKIKENDNSKLEKIPENIKEENLFFEPEFNIKDEEDNEYLLNKRMENENDDYFSNINIRSKVSNKTYIDYIKTYKGGYKIFLILFSLILVSKIMDIILKSTLPLLSKNYEEISKDKKLKYRIVNYVLDSKIKKYFVYYIGISASYALLNGIIEQIISRETLHSMKLIHEKMIFRLLKAPINYFYELPVGQILNHFTKDLELVEGSIKKITEFIKTIFSLGACIYICYQYNKLIIFISPIVIIFGFYLTNYYLKAGRNLTRLLCKSYSPILTILYEILKGVNTIRSAHAEKNIKEKIYMKIDEYFNIFLYMEGCKNWLSIRRSFFTEIFFGGIILSMAYSKKYSANAIAIILTFTEEFLIHLINATTFYGDLEFSMIGFERCEKLLEIPMEKGKYINLNIDENWPEKGKIEFKNVYASYRSNTTFVLKNINILINPGEKIGIVGRTGSGKSSILMLLSKILNPKKGDIFIDDINIKNIDLNILRDKLSIISQEPFIIGSNLRDNIDPFHKYSDEKILDIVENFGLFSDQKNKLDIIIQENGENLNSGEKQLICFARTVIKNNKIILLDEATSNLDHQTEKKIMKIMKKYFNDYTVIIVTHHLKMVKDCDKIYILEEGKIAKSGTYDSLIHNNNFDQNLYSSLIDDE